MTSLNTTTDASEVNRSTTFEPYQRPFDETVIWVSGFIIFTLLIIGVVLNAVTVAVIVKYKKLRNVFVVLIFSLCMSDLLSALISPFYWYHRTLGFDYWDLPGFFCKFYYAADYMTSFATAMHILAFGIFRLMSVLFPHRFSKVSNKVAIVCAIGIWTICLGCAFVPYSIWFGARVRDRYSSSQDARWPACTVNMEWYAQYTLFQKIGYSLFLYIPLILVVIISILTCRQVYATAKTSSSSMVKKKLQKEKQAVLQLTLIVVSFLVGYLPFTAYEFWSVQDHGNSDYYKYADYYFGITEYFLLRFSECMNPIFYNLGSTKMRNHTLHFLKSCFKKSNPVFLSTSGSRQVTESRTSEM